MTISEVEILKLKARDISIRRDISVSFYEDKNIDNGYTLSIKYSNSYRLRQVIYEC